MRAVIYARYSSSGQREESIEGQIRECTEYASRNDFDIVNVYTDKALTGRTDRRPGFQQMIKDSERHLFDAVICWKTDRFARNRYDSAVYKAKLRKNGVRLFYARETIPDGAEGIILESVMEGFAEYYSANLSENVKRGYYDSALQFKTLGKRVLGYRKAADGTFEIDDSTAFIVKRIFSEFSQGRIMADIVRDLNRDGLKTIQGKPFNKSSLRRILSNDKYIGVYEYDDIRAEDAIPALVDKETFLICQQKLEKKQTASPKTRNGVRYALTSKLFCGKCGASMTGDSATSATGRVYYWYTCNNRRRHWCDMKRFPKDELEKTIARKLMDILADKNKLEAIADRCMELSQQSENEELTAMQKKLSETEKKISNLVKVLASGLDSDAVREGLRDLEKEKEALSASVARLEAVSKPNLTKADILSVLDRLRTGDLESAEFRERLFETFLNAVYVYDDGRLVIHMNFGGETDTVSFDEHSEIVREMSHQACHVYYSRTGKLVTVIE